jgi:lysophospholipase L1-like esterase
MIFDGDKGIGAAGLGLVALVSACVSVAPEGEPSADARSAFVNDDGTFHEGLSIGQNTTWTIDRGSSQTFRVVAYGDSIFAGYQGGIFQVARRGAPYVAGEYLAKTWSTNVEVVRRAETGGLASEVLGRIVDDKSYMEDPSTRVVYFEMCGNDYLQARRAFASSSGACDLSMLSAALDTCTGNTKQAMDQINASARTAKRKAVANLYYPGFDRDNVAAGCTDPATGVQANVQTVLLPLIARSNWRVCDLARQNDFGCADAFAEFMGADYDTNGDGVVDTVGLRFRPGESEDAYVKRITTTLRATVRDANHHGLAAGSTIGYLFTDDIHPTAFSDSIGNGADGRSSPDFPDSQIVGGKNPKWYLFGHERIGMALANLGPAAP